MRNVNVDVIGVVSIIRSPYMIEDLLIRENMSGIDLCKKIRETEAIKELKIMLLTVVNFTGIGKEQLGERQRESSLSGRRSSR